MMYLMVASPSLLPVDQSSVAMLEWCREDDAGRHWVRNVESRADTLLTRKEILKEIKDAWMQLIILRRKQSTAGDTRGAASQRRRAPQLRLVEVAVGVH